MVSNGLPTPLMQETVWLDANKFHEAERKYHELATKKKPFAYASTPSGKAMSSLASEIQYARQKIQNFLKSGDLNIIDANASSLLTRVQRLENEKNEYEKQLSLLAAKFTDVLSKLTFLEQALQEANILKCQKDALDRANARCRRLQMEGRDADDDEYEDYDDDDVEEEVGDDDDIDLFGSEEENEEEAKLKEERLKAYAQKKAKKPALVAKSSVVLDVKPWDDETDMKAMETAVRNIECDGLVWGASKLVPLAYGIKKLQIVAVVEDDKVSVDWLQETIEAVKDLVQSVDIAAFNKL